MTAARPVIGRHPAHYPDLEPCADRAQHVARLLDAATGVAAHPAMTPVAERPAAVKGEHRCSSVPCLCGRLGPKR